MVKSLPASARDAEDISSFWDWEDILETEVTIHSIILA